MTDEEFATRTIDVKEMERRARANRTDREVIDAVESRVVRIETRLAQFLRACGYDIHNLNPGAPPHPAPPARPN